jgi:hypothetical protein
MVSRRTTLPLALALSLAVALPAGAEAKAGGPVANAAGGDAPPLTPSIVGVPLGRADKALDNAADAIDSGNGAQAAGPLRASRRYMIRAYRGARYLIQNAPPPPAEEASTARKFKRLARRAIRASHRGRTTGGWISAQASQDDAAGPVFADLPTAVFSVFTGQYDTATTATGMLPDVKGALLNRVRTSLNTAIVLRNRLVKVVAAASPPAPEEARAAQDEEAATFDTVMPGVGILLGDEIQQMTATRQDTNVPAASRAVLADALQADNTILTRVNTLWPPVTED